MDETTQAEIKALCKQIYNEVNLFRNEFAQLTVTEDENGRRIEMAVTYDPFKNRSLFYEKSEQISEMLKTLFFVEFPFSDEGEPPRYCARLDVISDFSEIAAYCVKNIYNANHREKRDNEDFLFFLFVLVSLFTKPEEQAALNIDERDAISREFIPYIERAKRKYLSSNDTFTYTFYPSSAAPAFMQDAMANIRNLKTYQKRQSEISHGKKTISVSTGSSSTKIKSETKNTHGTNQVIEFDNKVLSRINKASAKLLVFVLSEAQRQTHKGILSNLDISFPLKDLVDCGMYSTMQNARRGFENTADALTSIKWSDKSKKTGDYDLQVCFTGAKIKNGICTVQFNERLNWKEVFKQYTLIDPKIYQFDTNPFRLMLYVYTQARLDACRESLVEKGYFDLSIKSIANKLGLPDTRPREYVIDPIEKAVEDIEKLYCPSNTDNEFLGFEFINWDLPAKRLLEEGKLRVIMKGEFVEDIKKAHQQLTQKKEKAIKENEKRKAAAMAKAAAENGE